MATTIQRNPLDLVVCMPTRTTPTPETLRALRLNSPPHRLLTEIGKPVDEARNSLAARVLALDPIPTVVAWIDDDAFWLPGALDALVGELSRRPDLAMIAGGFSQRAPNLPCVAFWRAGDGLSVLIPGSAGKGNCGFHEIVPIEECGFHACVLRTSALAALGPAPFATDPNGTLTEDFVFCKRLRDGGFGIACAPGATFLHVDTSLGVAFAPCSTACKIVGGRPLPLERRDVEALSKKPNVKVTQIWTPDGRRGARVEVTVQSQRAYGPAVVG